MTEKTVDKIEGGGSFEVRDDKVVLREAPTIDHPEGNRPRAADGTPLNVAPEIPPIPPLSKGGETAEPAPRRPRVPVAAGASGD